MKAAEHDLKNDIATLCHTILPHPGIGDGVWEVVGVVANDFIQLHAAGGV